MERTPLCILILNICYAEPNGVSRVDLDDHLSAYHDRRDAVATTFAIQKLFADRLIAVDFTEMDYCLYRITEAGKLAADCAIFTAFVEAL